MGQLTCAEAKRIDLVQFLSDLGFKPNKIQGNDFWYCSPLRSEKEPSFKVNRKFNVWYDHGIQKGGNLVDFGILFYHCSVSEFLAQLDQPKKLSFHQPILHSIKMPTIEADEKGKIILQDVREPIQSGALFDYLNSRKIPLEIANQFCREVDFNLYDKKYTVIGFPNNAGGYELRSASFKGSCSPKDVTLVGKNLSKEILVFEGFMDFLSFQTIQHRKNILLSKQQPNFLILNSIGFLEKMKERLESYPSIHLYLDRDHKGITLTKELLAINQKYHDKSQLYCKLKDLNEYLIKEYRAIKQSRRLGRRL